MVVVEVLMTRDVITFLS